MYGQLNALRRVYAWRSKRKAGSYMKLFLAALCTAVVLVLVFLPKDRGQSTDYPKDQVIITKPESRATQVAPAAAQAKERKPKPESEADKKARERFESLVRQSVRRAYAQSTQEKLWRSGIECKVQTRGPHETTLYLQYALAGDSFRFQFGEGFVGPYTAELREMGFTKVEVSDGFSYGWVWTL